MTYDLLFDFILRGILRRNPTAMVQTVRTDGQNFSARKDNYLKDATCQTRARERRLIFPFK